MSLLTFLSFSTALFLISSGVSAVVVPRATACNGFPELCGRSYGNVTMFGTHDSYAIGTDVGANQDQSVTTQLNDGSRMLQLQALQQPNGIELCHTSCVIHDGGPAASFLGEVKTWLQTNKNNVVTILIANVDNIPAVSWKQLYENVGIDSISYSPPAANISVTHWPTLGEMIGNGTNLVTFLDNQADFTQAPYIIDEFSNMWETPFDVTSASEFQCTVNRTHGNPANQLITINHFLDTETSIVGISVPIPDKAALNTTNGVTGPGSLGAEVEACVQNHGRSPNFMLVDFYEFAGDSVLEVVASANGLPFTSTSIAQPVATGTSGNSSGGNGSGGGVTSTPLNGASNRRSNAPWLATIVAVACSILFGVLTAL